MSCPHTTTATATTALIDLQCIFNQLWSKPFSLWLKLNLFFFCMVFAAITNSFDWTEFTFKFSRSVWLNRLSAFQGIVTFTMSVSPPVMCVCVWGSRFVNDLQYEMLKCVKSYFIIDTDIDLGVSKEAAGWLSEAKFISLPRWHADLLKGFYDQ